MSFSRCSSCGARLDKEPEFCPECGASLTYGTAVQTAATYRQAPTRRRDAIVIGAVLLLAVAAYFVLKQLSPAPDPATRSDMPDYLLEMLNQLGNDYNGLVSAGNRFMDEGKFAVAAEMYRRALAIDGESPDVRTDFGACLHSVGLTERAIDEFRKVIAHHPEHAVAHLNMGIAYFTEGQQDSARHYWERFLSVEPAGSRADMVRDYLRQLDS